MDASDLVSPISSSDGDKVELGINESTFDGNLDFFCELDSESNVSVEISDGNNSLKSGSLSSLGLFLDGDDFHNLIRKFLLRGLEESINNWGFLDGESVVVDLFETLDFLCLNQSSEFGKRSPCVLVISSSWATSASESLLESTTIATGTATGCFLLSSFGHVLIRATI